MIIDGKKIAENLRLTLKDKIAQIPINKRKPGLSVILIGENPASEIYVRNKEKFANEIGIASVVLRFNSSISESYLIKEIDKLNEDQTVHGILVQLPLPSHINSKKIISGINLLRLGNNPVKIDGKDIYNIISKNIF